MSLWLRLPTTCRHRTPDKNLKSLTWTLLNLSTTHKLATTIKAIFRTHEFHRPITRQVKENVNYCASFFLSSTRCKNVRLAQNTLSRSLPSFSQRSIFNCRLRLDLLLLQFSLTHWTHLKNGTRLYILFIIHSVSDGVSWLGIITYVFTFSEISAVKRDRFEIMIQWFL